MMAKSRKNDVEPDGVIEVDGERFIVSDVYEDGSVEVWERFVIRPGAYKVIKRGRHG